MTWTNITRRSDAPILFAASAYNSCRTAKTEPRTTRAQRGTDAIPTAIIAFVSPLPRIVTIASAKGKAERASVRSGCYRNIRIPETSHPFPRREAGAFWAVGLGFPAARRCICPAD
jgi:hypothetical protein